VSALSTQIGQPVPFFYGVLEEGWNTQALEEDYDYVITGIIFSMAEGVGLTEIVLADESEVYMLNVYLEGPGGALPPVFSWQGELPIGPRTAVSLYASNGSVTAIVTGYALTPPSILHI
jgi:hypothetical protein